MDFRVHEEQEELRRTVRQFCARRLARARLDEIAQAGRVDRTLWSELAEMSVFDLRVSVARGGLGRSSADAVLVFAELGRALVPGPVAWTHAAAALLPGAPAGELVVGGVDATGDDARGPLFVEHLSSLDALLVLHDDRVERVDPAKLEAKQVSTPLDPLTPVSVVTALPRGELLAAADGAARVRREVTALVAAELLGVAEQTLELAVGYAKMREQFGRPIGSFQAIKHVLADMFVRLEIARAAVYAAGATLDAPEVGDVDRAVSVAKLQAGAAAIDNARACIQVHGGMGYTWELPAHLYLKRAWALENVLGTRESHARRIAADR